MWKQDDIEAHTRNYQQDDNNHVQRLFDFPNCVAQTEYHEWVSGKNWHIVE